MAVSYTHLDPTALRRAVIDVLMINAAVHTAAVTNLEKEAFHDAMEGLGMLMSLPTSPGPCLLYTSTARHNELVEREIALFSIGNRH